MSKSSKVSPEQELKFLCDFSVRDCVAHVSEFSPGTEYFSAPDAEVLIKSLQNTADLTGVLIDGFAGVRRAGILDDRVVFYNRREEEMLKQLAEIPRHEHVHWMFKEVLKIQDEWLGKFRAALPGVKIVYFIDSDDLDSTSERMLRVIVQSGKVKISASQKSLEKYRLENQKKLDGFGKIKVDDLQAKLSELEEKRNGYIKERGKKGLKAIDQQIANAKEDIALIDRRQTLEIKKKLCKEQGNEKLLEETEAELVEVNSAISVKEQGLLKTLNFLVAQREMLTNVRGKQAERKALDMAIKTAQAQIETVRGRISRIEAKTNRLEEEFKNYREPESSPVYQRRVDDHVAQLYKRFTDLGEKHNIEIVTKPGVLVFGTLVVDYAHDRGRTWHPMPGRVKKLAQAYHGLMDSYRENIAEVLKEREAPVHDIDIIMESGHHGVFFARWQRLNLTEEEVRMQHVNTFYTGGSDGVKHVVFLVGMPFEPQDKIASYINRGKPGRTRAGKMMGSANHPVFIRAFQRSVSGMTIIRKHNHGLISVEPVMYKLFRNGDVLKPFKGVLSQHDSDNHFNSPEMDPLGTLGTLAMNAEMMNQPLVLNGQPVYLGGTANIGDTGEANSTAWKEAHKFRRHVMGMVQDIPAELVATDTTDYEAVLRTPLRYANDMMGGSNENLKLTTRVVAWYLKRQFLNVYHNSPSRLLDIQVDLEGNHFANAVRGSGFQEHNAWEDTLITWQEEHIDFPERGLEPFPLKIMAGGEPQYFKPELGKTEMVVHLGGYSVSRQALVPAYGVGYDGKLVVQKPYRVGLSHEPDNVLNKARNQQADVIWTGHTHESYLTVDKSGDNNGRFIDQKPCTQRVSPTELVYAGIPRTAGVDLVVLTMPGHYWKMTIPAEHMRRIGLAWLRVKAKEAVEKKFGTKKK